MQDEMVIHQVHLENDRQGRVVVNVNGNEKKNVKKIEKEEKNIYLHLKKII